MDALLKYARDNGCPWDLYTCAYAADAEHLDILKFARDNGCPWDERTCLYAAMRQDSTLIATFLIMARIDDAGQDSCPMSAQT